MSKDFIRKDAINAIIDCLEDGYDDYLYDLPNKALNSSYYVEETATARELLNEYDVFDAIKKVVEYEKSEFDKILTDISRPENLINMLFYIIGEDVLFDVGNNYPIYYSNEDEKCTPEIAKAIIEELKKML